MFKHPFPRFRNAVALAAVFGFTGAALAQNAVIYPAKGQSAEQQQRDRYECYEWAKAQTGFDPTQAAPMPTSYQSAPSAQSGSSLSTTGGMVGGAIGGAAVAELTKGDAGKGAAYGALGGAMLGQMKQHKAVQANQATQQQQMQQMAQQQAGRNQQRASYDRHLGACMEGRGYTVK